MHFEGVETINVAQDTLWTFLTDPNLVGECVPGLKSLDIIEPGRTFQALAAIGLGSVKVSMTADAEWRELDPPNRAVMTIHSTAPGSAVDVNSEMTLSNNGNDTTILTWAAEVMVSGTIASLAARVMGSVANKLTGQFFKCIKSKIEA